MHKLEAKEKKKSNLFKVETAYVAEVESPDIPGPYLSPLVNPFTFNFSFLILPNIISNNTPIFFP